MRTGVALLGAAGTITMALGVSVAPAGAGAPRPDAPPGRPIYVTHAGSGGVSAFRQGPDGRPIPIAPRVHTGPAFGIAFSPDARRVYVGTAPGSVVVFAVGPGGSLTRIGAAEGGAEPFGIAMSPDGRRLYVANIGDSTISTFAVARDGRIAEIDRFPSEEKNPRGLAVSPNGRFVFVGHGVPLGARTNLLSRYGVRADGRLRRLGPPVTIGGSGTGANFTPDGRFFYIVSNTRDKVYGFKVGADGGLAALPRSPYPTADFPDLMAMTGDGRNVYVSSPGLTPDDKVTGFSVRPDGRLVRLPGSPFRTAAKSPTGLAATPDGRHLYVSSAEDEAHVSTFRIDPGGALSRIDPPTPTGGATALFQSVGVLPNLAPTASFALRTRPAGQVTRFDAADSSDRDGQVARYDWDFGDGTVLRDGGPTPEHTYRAPGSYEVTLTVTDDEGCSVERVFTGQSALCSGSPGSRTTRLAAIHGTHPPVPPEEGGGQAPGRRPLDDL